ncbi:MAG: hypothetical protein P8Z40_11320, partial [Chloroflexota bacterium]
CWRLPHRSRTIYSKTIQHLVVSHPHKNKRREGRGLLLRPVFILPGGRKSGINILFVVCCMFSARCQHTVIGP